LRPPPQSTWTPIANVATYPSPSSVTVRRVCPPDWL